MYLLDICKFVQVSDEDTFMKILDLFFNRLFLSFKFIEKWKL